MEWNKNKNDCSYAYKKRLSTMQMLSSIVNRNILQEINDTQHRWNASSVHPKLTESITWGMLYYILWFYCEYTSSALCRWMITFARAKFSVRQRPNDALRFLSPDFVCLNHWKISHSLHAILGLSGQMKKKNWWHNK